MSNKEFVSWRAFNLISPIGDSRGDLNAANIAHMICYVNSKRESFNLKVEDFQMFKKPTMQDLKFSKLSKQAQAIISQFKK